MFEALGPVECRVLGCLVEKAVTVPATYPMTLKAVAGAANQTSGRDPVMHLGEHEVEAALDRLRERGFVRRVHASHGARVVKYRHVAGEVLGLEDAALAAVTVLLLRGSQTPGELRGRTQRLHDFATPDDVVEVLAGLGERDEPLVVEMDRRPGQKEQRWAHLLGGPVPIADTAASAAKPVATPEVGPEVAPLAAFVGHWEGTGAGSYPTIEPFGYLEEIDLIPVPGKPFLAYRSATRHAEDGRRLHAESGFLRCIDVDGSVELVVAQAPGLVEVAEGVVDDGELLMGSTVVAGSSTAKEVTSTERRYRVDGDRLTYDIAMAAVGQPLTHHLRATLQRS